MPEPAWFNLNHSPAFFFRTERRHPAPGAPLPEPLDNSGPPLYLPGFFVLFRMRSAFCHSILELLPRARTSADVFIERKLPLINRRIAEEDLLQSLDLWFKGHFREEGFQEREKRNTLQNLIYICRSRRHASRARGH